MQRRNPFFRHASKGRLRWALITLGGGVLCVVGTVALCLLAFYFELESSLPSIESLRPDHYNPATVSTMYAADGTVMGEFFVERRYVVDLERIPPHVIRAFLAAEDARFYEHQGVDVPGIVRAFWKNIEAGEIVQGGSTITQQVVKSFLLTPERTWMRKLKEAILARRIDRWLSKDEILYLYLNQIYLGSGAYGVEAAARTYFDRHVQELTLAEGALLAGLPKAPGRYSPFRNLERALERQRYVLGRMSEEGFVSPAEARQARRAAVRLVDPDGPSARGLSRHWSLKDLDFFTEEVRRRVEDRYDYDTLYKKGIEIHTTMDPRAQKLAQEALDRGLREYDKRHGYRGAARRVEGRERDRLVESLRERTEEPRPGMVVRGVVEDYRESSGTYGIDLGFAQGVLSASGRKWAGSRARFRSGDVVWVKLDEIQDSEWKTFLEQEPAVQGSIMAMNPRTGRVFCMVGGRDFEQSQFNRVTQAVRQPGSAFKPIVYAAALDKDYSQASVLTDSAFVYDDGLHGLWKPSNYDRRFWGPLSLRKALVHSRNVVSVKLLEEIGPGYVVDYAHRLGIRSSLTPTLSLALGASGVSLWELLTAYSAFAHQGKRTQPYLVSKIVDRHGNVLEKQRVEAQSVISPQTAFLMTDILKGVIQSGTGRKAAKLGRPAAGKTGTTNEYRDAWFIGYTPSVLAGAWVGFDDDGKSLGRKEAGGRVALPVWLYFMEKWLKDKPVEDFTAPPGIVFVKMNEITGTLAGPDDPDAVYAAFVEGNLPPEHYVSEESSSSSSSVSFFKSDIF